MQITSNERREAGVTKYGNGAMKDGRRIVGQTNYKNGSIIGYNLDFFFITVSSMVFLVIVGSTNGVGSNI